MYHPDANPNNEQQAKEKFIQLTDAYRRLTSIVPPAPRKPSSPKPNSPKPNSPKPSSPERAQRSPQPVQATPQPPQPNPGKPPFTPSVRFTPDLSPNDRRLKQNTYEQLQQALKAQRFPRAITLVEGLAQRMPNDVEVRQWQAISYQRFGRHLIKTNQPEKAKLYLRKALRTDPHNRSLWYEIERDLQRIDQVEIL
jgi:tetratricopeptide (TPR) repeat protein